MSEKRPNLKKLAYMLAVYSNSTIPQTYMNEMSNYELLLTLMNKVNALIEQTNTMTDVVNEIIKLLNDFDDYVIEKLNDLFKEWEEEGIFDDHLETIAESYFANRPNNAPLDFTRLFRKLQQFGDSKLSSQGVKGTLHEHYAQGGTYFERNGLGYFAICYIPTTTVETPSTTNNYVIISLYQASDYECIGQRRFLLGHANSIDYNPNDDYLYVAWNSVAGGSGGSTNVSRILFTDIYGYNENITDFALMPAAIQSLQEDFTITYPNAQSYSSYVSYCKNDANQMYVGASMRIWLVAFDNTGGVTNATVIEQVTPESLVTEIATMQMTSSENGAPLWTWQVADVTDKYYYLLTYKSSEIFRISRTTNEIEYIYSLPSLLQKGMYFIGEPEDIKIMENGDIYLFTSHDIFAKNYSQYSMLQVFKSNLFTNVIEEERRDEKNGIEERMTLFVDANTHVANPTGRLNNPFNTIAEAVEFANTTECANAFTIRILATRTDFIQISTNKPIKIMKDTVYTERHDFVEHTVGEYTVKMPVISGVFCNGFSNVELDTLFIMMNFPTPALHGISAMVTAYNGSLYVNNCYISPTHIGITNITTAYKIECVVMNLTGAYAFTIENNEYNVENYSNINNLWTYGRFINHQISTVNSHGYASKNPSILG